MAPEMHFYNCLVQSAGLSMAWSILRPGCRGLKSVTIHPALTGTPSEEGMFKAPHHGRSGWIEVSDGAGYVASHG